MDSFILIIIAVVLITFLTVGNSIKANRIQELEFQIKQCQCIKE